MNGKNVKINESYNKIIKICDCDSECSSESSSSSSSLSNYEKCNYCIYLDECKRHWMNVSNYLKINQLSMKYCKKNSLSNDSSDNNSWIYCDLDFVDILNKRKDFNFNKINEENYIFKYLVSNDIVNLQDRYSVL